MESGQLQFGRWRLDFVLLRIVYLVFSCFSTLSSKRTNQRAETITITTIFLLQIYRIYYHYYYHYYHHYYSAAQEEGLLAMSKTMLNHKPHRVFPPIVR